MQSINKYKDISIAIVSIHLIRYSSRSLPNDFSSHRTLRQKLPEGPTFSLRASSRRPSTDISATQPCYLWFIVSKMILLPFYPWSQIGVLQLLLKSVCFSKGRDLPKVSMDFDSFGFMDFSWLAKLINLFEYFSSK